MQARQDPEPGSVDKAGRGKGRGRGVREGTKGERKTKSDAGSVHRGKLPKAPLRYDFIDTYRGPMCVIGTVTNVKAQRKYITLTEWPSSLLGAYAAGILSGESELVARAIQGMSTRHD